MTVLKAKRKWSFIGVDRFRWWSWGDLNPRAPQSGCGFRASRANYVRFAQGEYRSTRPGDEAMSHAGSGHFHRYNIQASRPSFGAALRLVIPKEMRLYDRSK